jgi:hypothetical protein
MHLTVMVDLQCVDFRVEGESGEGRGGDKACVSEEEGRGRDSMEGRRVHNATLAVRRRWHVERWEMTQLGRVAGWLDK